MTFFNFPKEIYWKIYHYLELGEVLKNSSISKNIHDGLLKENDFWEDLLNRDFTERLPFAKQVEVSKKEEYKTLYEFITTKPFVFIHSFYASLPKEFLKEFVCDQMWRACFLLKTAPSFDKDNASIKKGKSLDWLKTACMLNNQMLVKNIVTDNRDIKLEKENIQTMVLFCKPDLFAWLVNNEVIEIEKYFSNMLLSNWELYDSNARENIRCLYKKGVRISCRHHQEDHRMDLATYIGIVRNSTLFDDTDYFFSIVNDDKFAVLKAQLNWEFVLESASEFRSTKIIQPIVSDLVQGDGNHKIGEDTFQKIAESITLLDDQQYFLAVINDTRFTELSKQLNWNSILFQALKFRSKKIVEYIDKEKKLKIDQNILNKLLAEGSHDGDHEFFKYILDKIDKSNVIVDFNKFDLSLVISCDDLEFFKAVVNKRTKEYSKNELETALRENKVEIFKYILEKIKTQENKKNNRYGYGVYSTLCNSILYCFEIMKYMIDKEKVWPEQNPLYKLVANHTIDKLFIKIEYLIKHMKNNIDTNKLLDIVFLKRDYLTMKYLVEKENVKLKEEQINDYFIMAAANNDLKTLKKILQQDDRKGKIDLTDYINRVNKHYKGDFRQAGLNMETFEFLKDQKLLKLSFYEKYGCTIS